MDDVGAGGGMGEHSGGYCRWTRQGGKKHGAVSGKHDGGDASAWAQL